MIGVLSCFLSLLSTFGVYQSDAKDVISPDALLTTRVGGLENTHSVANIVPVTGQTFQSALHVVIGADAAETNATQLTLQNTAPVRKGDVLLASFSLRGVSSNGKVPAQAMFLFERTVSPWTKSVSQGASASKNAAVWKRITLPFTSAEDYAPGEVMASLRFAFGMQTVEVGGLTVVNYGKARTIESLQALAIEQNRLGSVHVAIQREEFHQTIQGFGGDFCQPRYGSKEPMDLVGRYTLEHLTVAHARIGIPLNNWTPTKGVYNDDGQAHAALLQMQEMKKHGIPFVGSIWEGPQWMLGGRPEQMGRKLPTENVQDCIEAIAQFLVTARDKYSAEPAYISFNEADYGVNFLFTSADIANFIRRAGPRLRELNLKTKFLVGDTTGGMPFVKYARPLLEDKEIASYLGPLAFHCWDVLGVSDAVYIGIAELGREFHKPVWCTEAGHDSALWEAPNPWGTWDNAIRTALAYEKTLRLSGAEIMDYWTYQDNYPIVDPKSGEPYPVFEVIRQMADALPPGCRIVSVGNEQEDDLRVLASVGPKPGRFSALLINQIGIGKVTLSGLPPAIGISITTRTAEGKSIQMTGSVDASGHITIQMPARSVVTMHTAN